MNFCKLGTLVPSLSFIIFLLSACNNIFPKIDTKLKGSIVKITYGNESGHSTGFFVVGGQSGCTVLTVRHAVKEGLDIRVSAEVDKRRRFDISEPQIKRSNNDDVAIISFRVEGKSACPYPALELGESDELTLGETVYVVGYPERAGQENLVVQFPHGSITSIQEPSLPYGYGVSYDVETIGGMSGSPVINSNGKVVAVHGFADTELVTLGSQYQGDLVDRQIDELDKAEERSQQTAATYHFKWGIPIQSFIRQRYELVHSAPLGDGFLKLDDTVQRDSSSLMSSANALQRQENWQDSLELYNQVLEDSPKNFEAWTNKGVSLSNLARYDEALDAYDRVVRIRPNNASAWINKGKALDDLERYGEALNSYDKALTLDSHNALIWYEKGNTLDNLARYRDAVKAYDKALSINPNSIHAWHNRGWALSNMGAYERAVSSYDKALDINYNYSSAWSNKAWALEELDRNYEALAAYEEAIKIDKDNKEASTGLDRLKTKLVTD